MKRSTAMTLVLFCAPAVFARIHTPRLDAFHAELRKCNADLSAAKEAARNQPRAERKKLVHAAKEAYARCEAHAYRVYKFWPNRPPEDAPPAP